MKRLLSLITSLVLVIVLASTSFAYGEKSKETPMKPYFVSFNKNVDLNLIKSYGGQVKRQYKYMPVVSVNLPEKVTEALAKNPNVDYVEEDGKVQAIGQITPWGIPHVKATDVQNTDISGQGIKVAVLDTGIDYTHEDLRVTSGATFVQGETDYMDDNGHGTHVAGTIAALNNTIGVLGTAPEASLYAVKVLNQNGGGTYSDVVAGIEWAITNSMNIINMSLGGSNDSRTLQTAVDNAYNTGILVVASGGNNGYDRKGTISYPAKYSSVIAVGAVDQQNKRAFFSSVGRELELMAPGLDVQSTVPGGYASNNGTSMSAPHVSGVAALVWEKKPELTNVQIRNSLNQTAVTLGDSFSYGNGLVNSLSAINYSETTKTTTGGGKKNNK
jgi:subtilisin